MSFAILIQLQIRIPIKSAAIVCWLWRNLTGVVRTIELGRRSKARQNIPTVAIDGTLVPLINGIYCHTGLRSVCSCIALTAFVPRLIIGIYHKTVYQKSGVFVITFIAKIFASLSRGEIKPLPTGCQLFGMIKRIKRNVDVLGQPTSGGT